MSEQVSDLPAETPADGAAEIVSFSQLPFVRPKPPSAAAAAEAPGGPSSPTSSSIRLFGFDFPPDVGGTAASSSVTTNGDAAANHGDPGQAASGTASGAGRKFECHYCCRNFPTSQALGGHQNAHKRERQHAKRAQFQSAMAMQHVHHGHYSAYPAFAGAGGYHHRFVAAPAPPHMGGNGRYEPPPHYPSWSSANHLAPPMVPASRYYGGPGSVSEPINGSPVPASALWRLPGAVNVAAGAAPVPPPQQERPALVARRDEMAAAWGSRRGVTQAAGSASSASSASSSSQHEARHGAGDAAEKRANVSLDLTL
ncbi:zinc finger protein 8 [Brachypodium distachyon]|uniref:C2H2-type domain-containing protein n=1 Tax=Brachypodium distachyon TaxID=15368 RepID=I1IQJ8_BRADI|nr:zinc finger protein 8 [Brachypodium distachyon]KQJ90446.1 hypothetical protein BRADI_4g31590v3 [Brachypodium distachyon]|eukprot:XP_003576583.1 zinc finger protein 8 [Brachypodium distachyon]